MPTLCWHRVGTHCPALPLFCPGAGASTLVSSGPRGPLLGRVSSSRGWGSQQFRSMINCLNRSDFGACTLVFLGRVFERPRPNDEEVYSSREHQSLAPPHRARTVRRARSAHTEAVCTLRRTLTVGSGGSAGRVSGPKTFDPLEPHCPVCAHTLSWALSSFHSPAVNKRTFSKTAVQRIALQEGGGSPFRGLRG